MSNSRPANTTEVRVRLERLELTACIGVPEYERRRPQRLLADVDVWCDACAPIDSDEVHDSVDYARLAERIRDEAATVSVKLLERLVAKLCSAVIVSFPAAREVRIRLCKPDVIPRCGCAVVEGSQQRSE
ncbi:MAG: dihydroneopterin aldolase [Spirochaetales bacterium]